MTVNTSPSVNVMTERAVSGPVINNNLEIASGESIRVDEQSARCCRNPFEGCHAKCINPIKDFCCPERDFYDEDMRGTPAEWCCCLLIIGGLATGMGLFCD